MFVRTVAYKRGKLDENTDQNLETVNHSLYRKFDLQGSFSETQQHQSA